MRFETIEQCDKVLKFYTNCKVPEPVPIKIKVHDEYMIAYFIPEVTLDGFDYENTSGLITKEGAIDEIESLIRCGLEDAEFYKSQLIKEQKEQEEEDKRLFFVNQFTESMTPLQKGRVIKTLDTKKWYGDEIMTRSEYIEHLIYGGWKLTTYNDEPVLRNTGDIYYSKRGLTKTGMDYAKFLIDTKITS